MHTEKIKVVLDRNRSVNVEATVSHSYISTGDPGSGSPNVTHYDIVCMGIECEGTWCDDARYPTTVHDCPDELRAALEQFTRPNKSRETRGRSLDCGSRCGHVVYRITHGRSARRYRSTYGCPS